MPNSKVFQEAKQAQRLSNIDVFQPVRAKNGDKVEIEDVDLKAGVKWPIIARVTDANGDSHRFSFQSNGMFGNDPSDDDIENSPETKTFWVNVYEDGGLNTHRTEAYAKEIACDDIFARVKVTVEEGAGLD